MIIGPASLAPVNNLNNIICVKIRSLMFEYLYEVYKKNVWFLRNLFQSLRAFWMQKKKSFRNKTPSVKHSPEAGNVLKPKISTRADSNIKRITENARPGRDGCSEIFGIRSDLSDRVNTAFAA